MKSKIYNFILFISIIAFYVVCFFVYKDIKKIYECKNTYDEIKKQCVSEKTTQNDNKKIAWDKLYKLNSDIVAWIEIPDTPIDYPVLKSENYDYYLSHDIHKEYSKFGAIFIDQRLYNNPFESKNFIVYGHNMGHWTDVMFGSLMEYKEKKYFDKHKYVYLYTPKIRETYQIVSVREVSSSSDAYNIDFEKGEFKNWINNVISKSIYPCTDNVGNVKHIMTLSTCTYGENRLVMHCIPT